MTMRLNWIKLWQPRSAHVLAALALAASSSCASSRWVARWEPSQRDLAPAVRSIAPPQPQTTVVTDTAVQHAVVDETSPASGGIEQMAFETDAVDDLATTRSIENDGFVAAGQSPEPACEPIPYAPIPRMPLGPGCPPGSPCPTAVCMPGRCDDLPYPEEMLCDGGDSGHPFHYDGGKFAGLEAEDTVAEFVDHEGTAHVRISSQACVYAPKFGSVRSISQPVQDISVDVLGGTHRSLGAERLDDERGLVINESVDQAKDTRVREQAGGVDSDVSESAMHQNLAIEQHIKLVNAFEDRNSLREWQLQQTTEAYLAATVQIAGESISDIGPIIVANDIFGQTVTSVDSASEYSVAEDRRPPGDLRVVKLADQPSAQPGDVLTFRIRFYNDGGRELKSVRILDHISPRLEYVEGSAVSELDGKLTAESDEYGGQILQFVLDAPLEGGKSGEICFQATAK